MERSDVLSVDEAAVYLGVDRKLVYRGIIKGEIPHARLGRRILLSRRVIDAWLAGQSINPASR
ncbi:MAG: helix-turn-helix domain-containing protein [Pseudomonadota bacterium]